MRFLLPPEVDHSTEKTYCLPPKDLGGEVLHHSSNQSAFSANQLLRWEESLIHESTLEASPPGEEPEEIFSLWEFQQTCVVLGRGSKIDEVHVELCEEHDVPILRRCSGGATIVAGPGCLMYSVILSLQERPFLRAIDGAHRFVMGRIHDAVKNIAPQVELQGICDLTIDNRKFSGNALRYKRDWLLYHGTILYQFPLDSISRYLRTPPRQPEYRARRSHEDFLTNIKATRQQLEHYLCESWGVTNPARRNT